MFDALLPCFAPPDDVYQMGMEIEMLRFRLRELQDQNKSLKTGHAAAVVQSVMPRDAPVSPPTDSPIDSNDSDFEAALAQPVKHSGSVPNKPLKRMQTVGWGMIV